MRRLSDLAPSIKIILAGTVLGALALVSLPASLAAEDAPAKPMSSDQVAASPKTSDDQSAANPGDKGQPDADKAPSNYKNPDVEAVLRNKETARQAVKDAARDKAASNYRNPSAANAAKQSGAGNYRKDVPSDLQARQLEANQRLAAERRDMAIDQQRTQMEVMKKNEPPTRSGITPPGAPLPGFMYH